MTIQKVLLLGFGEMGHAMQALLRTHHRVEVWQRSDTRTLAAATTDSDVVVFCVPARAHSDLSRQLAAHVKRSTVCISIAKGLDIDGRTAVEIFDAAFAAHCDYAFLYGPMIAEELQRGRTGFADVAANTSAARAVVHRLFDTSALVLRDSDDAAGASWCAILKNVYAVLFGCIDELDLGDNLRGFLTVVAVDELTQLLPQLGGNAETARRWPGLGDLITTATSRNSHHHALGRRIARGASEALSGEAVNTVSVLAQHPRFQLKDVPLLNLAANCIAQPTRTITALPDALLNIARRLPVV